MDFKSRSQAGQDRFAFEVLGRPEKGTFLDIGANNPIDINNTYALEQMGWLGLLIDNSEQSKLACQEKRLSPFMLADATKIDWSDKLLESRWATNPPGQRKIPFKYDCDLSGGYVGTSVLIDYLSLDVDEATLDTLRSMPLGKLRFRVVTIEHDAYRFGEMRRDQMIDVLVKNGYEILCPDVCDQGLSFEIWAVDPKQVDLELAELYRRPLPTDWKHVRRLTA